MSPSSLGLTAILAVGLASPVAAQTVRSAAGSDAASIQAAVDQFRLDLGTLNPNEPGSFGSGRREINWDAVPDAFAAPNALPLDFFNANLSGRARGAVFSTPGSGVEVSATAASGVPVEFGDLNAAYPGNFAAFSPERLFTAVGSNVVDVQFFVPGTNVPARIHGFGAVFTDVDLANTTSLVFFDALGHALGGPFFVPGVASADETFSFLGVFFANPVVSRVRITSGNVALGPSEDLPGTDVAAMDDFIYGEPLQVTPEPTTLLLLGSGLAGLVGTRRRRARAAR